MPIDPGSLPIQNAGCLVCGYDLAGLSPAGACPECGTTIYRSLQGNLLAYSSPDYLRSLHTGVFLVVTTIAIQLIL